MSGAFASVAAHRVNANQPPRNTAQLDADRCAALHNAIALYGWLFSGRRIADMEKKSWWHKHGSDALAAFLRPSVVKFLKKCYNPSTTFFYYVKGLAAPKQLAQLGDILHDDEKKESPKDRFLILYTAPGDLVTHACGIVYDQYKHKAIYMPSFSHVYDLEDTKLPWQSLESILSIYIDMIEGNKAVALHQSIGRHAKTEAIEQPDGSIVETEIEPAGPAADPATGARPSRYNTHPWVLRSYTVEDLNSCLGIWERLFTAIETRAGIQQTPEEAEVTPLCGRSLLNAASIRKGFAYDLLSHARQPQIWYVAPGLRLPGATEFINQPFKHIRKQYPKETEDIMMPILFFRCEGTVSSKEANFRWPFSSVEQVPCGLYLDAYPNAQNPFEDAIRLVLPFKIGGNKHAKFSDGKPTHRSHVNLYGHGINPFIMRHGPKLVAILENWLSNVESGHWSVDAQGVAGGVDVWRKADTEEDWSKYQAAHQVI